MGRLIDTEIFEAVIKLYIAGGLYCIWKRGNVMNSNDKRVYTTKGEGFVTSSFWNKSLHLRTVDENGLDKDCYDDVVDDLTSKEDIVGRYYKKEKRENTWINFRYSLQLKWLVLNIVLTFLSVFLYVVLVGYHRTDLIYGTIGFLEKKLKPALFAKVDSVVNPVISFVQECGMENLFNSTLMILSITSFIALIIYMISRDHITIRWMTYILGITPLCKIKSVSDKRLVRLQSDLYNIQLRRHQVKFASHK